MLHRANLVILITLKTNKYQVCEFAVFIFAFRKVWMVTIVWIAFILLIDRFGIFVLYISRADIFSQLDDIDTLESGGRLANMDKHMANLNVTDSKSPGSGENIKLGPVITRKTPSHNSANSLNTLKRLPPQQPTKTRSIPITPEKSTAGKKNESSWPASPARKVFNSLLNFHVEFNESIVSIDCATICFSRPAEVLH